MSSREQAEQAASRFIAQRETGPWAPEDAAALDSWLAQSPSHRVAYYRLNAAWKEAGRASVLGLHGRRGRLFSPGAQARARRWAGYALAASLVLAVGTFGFRQNAEQVGQYQTAVGGLATVPIADGSRLTLNTDSQLSVVLSQDERHVELEKGEVFFEVAKDAKRPFVVSVGNQSVMAVGTAFSVRRVGVELHVSVTEGTVKMFPKGGSADKVVLLPAGSSATTRAGMVMVKKAPVQDLEQGLTWRSGVLTFRDTPLAEAVAEFNRYSSRKISIDDPAINDIRVGGMFRTTNVDTFLSLLEEGFPVAVSEEQDGVILRSK